MNWFYYNSPLFLQTLIWPGTRFKLWFYTKLEVKGLENLKDLPADKGVIFASNHTSELDPILLPASLPFRSRFMPIFYTSRERAFYKNAGIRQHIYGGWFFKLWGAHPVTAGLKDYEKSLLTHIEIVNRGNSVLIFPEGGIPKRIDGVIETKPARGGVIYLAEKTGAPIVPVTISGAYRISFADFYLRRRKITVEFGRPIYENAGSSDHSETSYSARAQIIVDKIMAVVAKDDTL